MKKKNSLRIAFCIPAITRTLLALIILCRYRIKIKGLYGFIPLLVCTHLSVQRSRVTLKKNRPWKRSEKRGTPETSLPQRH